MWPKQPVVYKLDPEQFRELLIRLDRLIARLPDDPSQLASLTAQLKKSSDALGEVIAQNSPST